MTWLRWLLFFLFPTLILLPRFNANAKKHTLWQLLSIGMLFYVLSFYVGSKRVHRPGRHHTKLARSSLFNKYINASFYSTFLNSFLLFHILKFFPSIPHSLVPVPLVFSWFSSSALYELQSNIQLLLIPFPDISMVQYSNQAIH